ncbi:hypothetical protein [Bacillus sp. SM2101]|uniref:hypothetical protein n=1 Tax=Bacillus sp. SM2101 TaxID=2805366 RepID=UPI001BDEFF77|nr:hypothetical protein [Bacillus sp. SM2101]
MKAFLTLDNAKLEIEKAEGYINDLKRFIGIVENYNADTFEKKVIKEYAILGSTTKVATKLSDEGYRYETGRKYKPEDMTEIIQSKNTIDELHVIVKDIQKKNKTKANRNWN